MSKNIPIPLGECNLHTMKYLGKTMRDCIVSCFDTYSLNCLLNCVLSKIEK